MPRPSIAPTSVAKPRVRGLTAGACYTAGGIAVAILNVTATFPSPADLVALHRLSVVAIVIGVVVMVVGARLPLAAFHVVTLFGNVMIFLGIPHCPSTAAAVAVASIYGFVAVDVMFFFAWRQAMVHYVVIAVLGSTALLQRGDVSVGAVILLVLVGAGMQAMVASLVQVATTANFDSLTGLSNRRGFDAALDQMLLEAPRRDGLLSAAFLDVDHFKAVNDGQGHAAGDKLLQAVAEHCAAALPDTAAVARYGGDEFAVLLPGVEGQQALEIVERVRSSMASTSISAGVAQLVPGESGSDLLRRADAALYAAKGAGRNQSRLDDVSSVALAQDLAAAIAAGDVKAWLQPIVSPTDSSISGWEALARWEHPTRGTIPPLDFIPLAESTGLIHELGAAILADACRAANTIRAAWHRDFLLTVNVSGRQLTAPNYVEDLLQTLRDTCWPADLLVVEVTESLLDGSSSDALRALENLRDRGISVAIDDFGTGYSSFSRLDTLPTDYLKLDHGFIADIATSPRRLAMLQALLQLAHALGIAVIAEGVEDRQQAELLARLGCPLAQGYYFGRPTDPAKVIESKPPAANASVQALTIAAARWAAHAAFAPEELEQVPEAPLLG